MAALLARTTLLSVISIAGCSSEKSSPTAPSGPVQPAQTLPSTPDKPAVVSIDIPERTATLSFRTVGNSPRYVIEVGTSAGASNVAVVTTGEGAGPGASFTRTFTDLPPGFVYVRAKAQNDAGTSAPSPELQFLVQDMKNVIDALFFQGGPYGGGDQVGGNHVVRGFRAGTRVTVRVSTSLTPAQRRGIESMLSQLGETGAPLTATLATMNGNQAFCVRNEIHVVTVNNACGTGLGCISASCPGQSITTPWETVSLFLGTAGQSGDSAQVAAHELGHALLGLYHLAYLGVAERPSHPAFFGTPEFPHTLMFWQMTTGAETLDRLSPLELKAVQTVFRAGLSAGATRADMGARGLIH